MALLSKGLSVRLNSLVRLTQSQCRLYIQFKGDFLLGNTILYFFLHLSDDLGRGLFLAKNHQCQILRAPWCCPELSHSKPLSMVIVLLVSRDGNP